MAKLKGLGRGLDALLSGNDSRSEDTLSELAVGMLRPGRFQPRTRMDPQSIAELADSIKSQGLIQPILVRPVEGGKYEIIAGERRWRAAQLAGLTQVPVVLRDVPDQAALAMALIENIQREDLNPLEEANGIQRLVDEFEMTHDAAAQAVGRSRSAVTNLLRLFQLPPQVQRLVADGQVSTGHAKALLGTPDRAFQEALARRVASEGLTVRETEEAVRLRQGRASDLPTPDGGTPGSKLRAPGLLELEELLADQLDTRVKINMGPKRGRVVIEFADLEDLERIYRVMATTPRP